MDAERMSRAEAVALVQRIIDMDYADDGELDDWLERLDQALVGPAGHVGDLIFHPGGPEPSAEDVVARALAYAPVTL
ncbi:e9imm peptide [Streptomyces chitinivorans]|uniref:E9imm peptide n=2 Tax=Streptomyces chitinivorans TaxID=1257027 RepID=A0ABW7HQ53_9ACTN|nr:e9imm peptide [Streptomyces chitinivorans]MDH2411267.1 e9imm peptide [Streptomyces chitinivorans]